MKAAIATMGIVIALLSLFLWRSASDVTELNAQIRGFKKLDIEVIGLQATNAELHKELGERDQLIANLQKKPGEGEVFVSFEPDPVVSIDNCWQVNIVLNNKGAIGVSLERLTMSRYASVAQILGGLWEVDITKMSDILPARSFVKIPVTFPSDGKTSSVSFGIFTAYFTDANGVLRETSNRVYFKPQ